MQLELSQQSEQCLSEEAAALGITVEEFSARVLNQHASEWQQRQEIKSPDRCHRIDAHIEWMKHGNTSYETTDPYAVDWQAVKAEGRRY